MDFNTKETVFSEINFCENKKRVTKTGITKKQKNAGKKYLSIKQLVQMKCEVWRDLRVRKAGRHLSPEKYITERH